MKVFFPILAQPLASDCIGLALLFVVVLAWMHHFDSLSSRTDEHRLAQRRLHRIGHRPH